MHAACSQHVETARFPHTRTCQKHENSGAPEMGEAVQMLPPMPEALRIGGPANHRSCSATARRVDVWSRQGGKACSSMSDGCFR